MARKINKDLCVGCGNCAEYCPADAIHEKDGKYVIDAKECIDCLSCTDWCVADAIEDAEEE